MGNLLALLIRMARALKSQQEENTDIHSNRKEMEREMNEDLVRYILPHGSLDANDRTSCTANTNTQKHIAHKTSSGVVISREYSKGFRREEHNSEEMTLWKFQASWRVRSLLQSLGQDKYR